MCVRFWFCFEERSLDFVPPPQPSLIRWAFPFFPKDPLAVAVFLLPPRFPCEFQVRTSLSEAGPLSRRLDRIDGVREFLFGRQVLVLSVFPYSSCSGGLFRSLSYFPFPNSHVRMVKSPFWRFPYFLSHPAFYLLRGVFSWRMRGRRGFWS